jgi:Zn-finger nucleic acid-binding protein
MKCPRCQVPLSPGRVDAAGLNLAAFNCAECTGHWLSLTDLRAAEQVVDVRLIAWRHLPGIETQGRILFCPACPGSKPMDKVVSTRDQRVVMDVCGTCSGVWLDYGELEAIQRKGLLSSLADIVRFLQKS